MYGIKYDMEKIAKILSQESDYLAINGNRFSFDYVYNTVMDELTERGLDNFWIDSNSKTVGDIDTVDFFEKLYQFEIYFINKNGIHETVGVLLCQYGSCGFQNFSYYSLID